MPSQHELVQGVKDLGMGIDYLQAVLSLMSLDLWILELPLGGGGEGRNGGGGGVALMGRKTTAPIMCYSISRLLCEMPSRAACMLAACMG